MKMFSVHDSKAEAYLNPFFFKTTGEALRAFETSCKDNNSQFYQYPSDFTIVELGMFDPLTANFSIYDKPRIIANAAEYVKIHNIPSHSQAGTPLHMLNELESRN